MPLYQFIRQKDQSATHIDMHAIHEETLLKNSYIKYKTHNTVNTQHIQLNEKNTLQYGSSTLGARDL